MAAIYILYSSNLDKYYIGSCKDFDLRMEEHISHLSHSNSNSFTKKARDWLVYLVVDNLSYSQSREVEAHIKRMKSKKYIQDLKHYPELLGKLISRYKNIESDQER